MKRTYQKFCKPKSIGIRQHPVTALQRCRHRVLVIGERICLWGTVKREANKTAMDIAVCVASGAAGAAVYMMCDKRRFWEKFYNAVA